MLRRVIDAVSPEKQDPIKNDLLNSLENSNWKKLLGLLESQYSLKYLWLLENDDGVKRQFIQALEKDLTFYEYFFRGSLGGNHATYGWKLLMFFLQPNKEIDIQFDLPVKVWNKVNILAGFLKVLEAYCQRQPDNAVHFFSYLMNTILLKPYAYENISMETIEAWRQSLETNLPADLDRGIYSALLKTQPGENKAGDPTYCISISQLVEIAKYRDSLTKQQTPTCYFWSPNEEQRVLKNEKRNFLNDFMKKIRNARTESQAKEALNTTLTTYPNALSGGIDLPLYGNFWQSTVATLVQKALPWLNLEKFTTERAKQRASLEG